MSRKHKGGAAPVPPANKSSYGPGKPLAERPPEVPEGEPASRKDAKGRLGGYETAGEHAIEQPGGKQGPNR